MDFWVWGYRKKEVKTMKPGIENLPLRLDSYKEVPLVSADAVGARRRRGCYVPFRSGRGVQGPRPKCWGVTGWKGCKVGRMYLHLRPGC